MNEGLKDSDDASKWLPFSFDVNNSESDDEESKEFEKSKESESTKKSPVGSESTTKSPEEFDVLWDIAWKNFFIGVVDPKWSRVWNGDLNRFEIHYLH